MDQKEPKEIRIFVGSPGDVSEERKKVKNVIDDVQRQYEGQAKLIPMLWEEVALLSTS